MKLLKKNIHKNIKLYSNESYKIYNEISEFNLKKESPISINKLIDLSKLPKKQMLYTSANYLYNEIPIRLSKQIKDLEKIPFELHHTNGVSKVREWYVKSFYDLRNYEKSEITDYLKFLNLIMLIYERHASTFIYMSKGIHEIKKLNYKLDNINELLNKFYKNRIGIRILLSHFIELNKDNNPDPDYFGCISLKTNPKKILDGAIENAICSASFNSMEVPKFIITGNDDIFFHYIPQHLQYCLFEIIKNGICAVNKINKNDKKIICSISHDNNLIVIKISDNGIGIKHENLKKIWEYGYSTTDIDLENHFENDFSENSPIAGLGYGISITRLYIEYFGGRIDIFSNYGIGTDVYLYLRKDGNFDELI